MSKFEFVTLLYSLVVAFGVSELLAALGRVLRDSDRTAIFVPQVLALLLLLLAFLQSLWGYWGFRQVEWSFWLFLVGFLPLLTLSIATSISIPAVSTDRERSREEEYFSTVRFVFPLIAVWVLLGAIAEFSLTPPVWHLGQGVRVVAIALLLALTRSRSSSVHTIGLALLVLCQISFVEFVTPVLG